MTDLNPSDNSKECLQYDCGGCIIEIDSLLDGRSNKNVADGEVYDSNETFANNATTCDAYRYSDSVLTNSLLDPARTETLGAI